MIKLLPKNLGKSYSFHKTSDKKSQPNKSNQTSLEYMLFHYINLVTNLCNETYSLDLVALI